MADTANTTTHEPADPGDVRFELVNIGAETEDPQMQVLVLTIDDRGRRGGARRVLVGVGGVRHDRGAP